MGVRSSGLGRRVMGRTYRTKVSTGRPEIPKAGSSNKSYMSMVSTTLQAIEDEESPQYCPDRELLDKFIEAGIISPEEGELDA